MPAPLTLKEANIDGTVQYADTSQTTFVDWGLMVGFASTSEMGASYVEISIADADRLRIWLTEFLNGK